MSGYRADWVAVPGHPGYAATAEGAVRGPMKVLRPMTSSSGHLYVITGARRKLWVHHAVLFAFVGAKPDGQECRHLDGDPTNNRLDNLRWGTRTENMRDKAAHGRERRGEDKPGARVTAAQAAAIRADERPSRVVGAEYGISHTSVLGIRRGRLWRTAS